MCASVSLAMANDQLTDDEERAEDARIGTLG
jgi:hypothetical protein